MSLSPSWYTNLLKALLTHWSRNMSVSGTEDYMTYSYQSGEGSWDQLWGFSRKELLQCSCYNFVDLYGIWRRHLKPIPILKQFFRPPPPFVLRSFLHYSVFLQWILNTQWSTYVCTVHNESIPRFLMKTCSSSSSGCMLSPFERQAGWVCCCAFFREGS